MRTRRNIWLVLLVLLVIPVAGWAADDLLLPPGTDSVWHGAYLPAKRTIKQSAILDFEQTAGKNVAVSMYFVGWYNNAWSDVQRQINVWQPMGVKTHVVWEPRLKGKKNPLTAIVNGSQDAIIDDFATKAAAWGQPFFLRFAHEMNGDWYPWSGANTGNNPQRYIYAWRYVWNRFQAKGATNVVWVWAPNWNSVPADPWNDMHRFLVVLSGI